MDGTVENVATAKHVKFAAAANSVAGEHVKKVAELLGLLGCYDIIQWFIFRLSKYINTVAAAHLIDTTPRRKNKDEVPVKKDDDPPWDELEDKASSTGANSFTGNAYWPFIDFAAFLMALRTPERFVEAFRLLDKVLVFDGCGTFPRRNISATYGLNTILVFRSRWFSVFCVVKLFCLRNILLFIHNEASDDFNEITHHRTHPMIDDLLNRFN